jgi:hypothetical protein
MWHHILSITLFILISNAIFLSVFVLFDGAVLPLFLLIYRKLAGKNRTITQKNEKLLCWQSGSTILSRFIHYNLALVLLLLFKPNLIVCVIVAIVLHLALLLDKINVLRLYIGEVKDRGHQELQEYKRRNYMLAQSIIELEKEKKALERSFNALKNKNNDLLKEVKLVKKSVNKNIMMDTDILDLN